MAPLQVVSFSVGALFVVIGAIYRWRQGKNAAWFLVLGALIFVLGGFVLG